MLPENLASPDTWIWTKIIPAPKAGAMTKLGDIRLTMDLSVYYVGATPSILTVSHRSKTQVLREYPKGADS